MKLWEALRFSWDRRAQHPSDDAEFPYEATDYGITLYSEEAIGVFGPEPLTAAWSDIDLELRRKLLQSEGWEPIDTKPAMLILAEAYALDWSDPEQPPEKDACSNER